MYRFLPAALIARVPVPISVNALVGMVSTGVPCGIEYRFTVSVWFDTPSCTPTSTLSIVLPAPGCSLK